MTALWIALAVLGWFAVAAVVGLTVAAAIRRRDRQVPRHHDARAGKPGRRHERTTR